ncbi:uncharacterized protein LOC130669569 [Microplitis mediator]|uniref:uncharacterized protein LOC130669569 n=1 Tax=Microplitis mediator TaxID=375433 RepID=UPI002553FE95|nr:uncharacterized protein LOC130669569 [Microplitis mediator]
MKLLIIFILPVISAQRYRGPNEEPFLPIYPIYPYSPKLMKRGAESHFLSQLNPEVFAQKHSPRDSYALNYYSTSNSNNNREQSTTQAYSLANPQAYTTMSTLHVPQNVNYNSNPSNYYNYPLAVLAQPQSYATAANYPNYQSNYQQAYVSANYPQQSYSTGKNQEKQRNESNFKDATFVDGSNYITIIKDLKDLEGQSTAQIPNAAYRLIGFEGVQRPPPPPSQPTAAASGYRYQQLDQMTAQALGRLIAQQSAISATAAPTYTPVTQNQYETEGYMPQTVQQNSPVIAKTGLAYVMNPMPINIVPRHIARGQDSYQDLRNQVTRPAANQVTQVSLEPSQGVYIPPMRIKSPRYSDYYTQASPAYPSNDQAQQNSAYVYPSYAGYAGLTSPEMNYKLIDNNNNYYATKRNIKVLKP